ncbi:MAG: prepilin-type N-terminal cleavage/methylation domain-containing protein [Candidatus Pacebacteria bacterium]|nr:prepilin-type N-terminal cleavage/methylation domain-containing protein [Candidatus Paceibacterota bacterium]PIR60919.1 MAG: hypothetical protein COU67_00475 [Candidatus Pacebacteria bacterium CG10_big_fil_rev_8_21_14_0_10_44_54]
MSSKRTIDVGFTLIELLVVISIIAVLTAILLPNLVGIRGRAADARKKADLKEFQSALRLYYNDNQKYPEEADLDEATGPFQNGTYSISVPEDSEYVRLSDDAYNMYVTLTNEADPDINESKTKCGISLDPDNFDYYVCAR